MAEIPVAGNDVGTSLEVKRVDKIRLPDSGKWIVQSAGSDAITSSKDEYAEWAACAFVVRRKVYQTRDSDFPVTTTKLLIRSFFLRGDLRDVMKDVDDISWNGAILKLDPEPLLKFLPRLNDLAQNLCDVPDGEESTRKKHLVFFIEFLESEYAATIQKISSLVQHGEIVFDFLWAIFTPGDAIFASCETTAEPRAYRLRKIRKVKQWLTNKPSWQLICDYVEAVDDPSLSGQRFGLATKQIEIEDFDGVKQIVELEAYPIMFHASAAQVQMKLVQRGRVWTKLCGRHHKQYDGLAWRGERLPDSTRRRAVRVNGRIMIDRGTFASAEPNYEHPSPHRSLLGRLLNASEGDASSPCPLVEEEGLQDQDLLLATPIVLGFSLTDKCWLEFNIECVSAIRWNNEGFRNLAIDPDRKILVQSLVESHSSEKESFDDFVTGKGVGLVINLFGPPGVGKTLTVEVTSEHLKRPLYVVSAGDLGTTPSALDEALIKIFWLAPAWNAVVLIDEADVFLEKRSTSDGRRTAMAAVFLRQLEYFQGILFLTTNRVKNFDPAFHSRIHLSLHYDHLSSRAKEQLWRAFLEKAQATDLSAVEFEDLSCLDLNGRQIKNVVKLSAALARHEERPLTYQHLVRTMGVTEDWDSKQETSISSYAVVLLRQWASLPWFHCVTLSS
ncbi:hypothetical protein B0H10DRAFT_1983969 [Mycena sp. CBHHK59/15]|nr:hypothetical protein B0H10DRAFT_1983969 [Mycena sp. CBHHK59/15]